MLTKRDLLAGCGALLVPFACEGPVQADPATASLTVETARLTLRAQVPSVEILRIASPSAPRLAQGSRSVLALKNATAQTISMDLQGARGGFDLQSAERRAWQGVIPNGTGILAFQPRDAGMSIIRAAPSLTHEAERGASCVMITSEADPPEVDHDVVLQLADWLLAADGGLRFGSTPPSDAVARIVTANGMAEPLTISAAPRARCRLRFANTSVQCVMMVTCAVARPMVAAIDGQPSALFAPVRNSFPIGPGARYELLLDLPEAADTTVRFTAKCLTSGPETSTADVLVLRAQGVAVPPKPPIKPLRPNPALPVQIPLEAAKRVDLTFAGIAGASGAAPHDWTVNGTSGGKATAPVITVRQGDAVTLGLANTSPILVPIRVGGQAVRLLHAKDDGWEPYWRDTLLLPPNSKNHVAFVADVPGRWPITSGFDDLTLAGLSCWFTVTPR